MTNDDVLFGFRLRVFDLAGRTTVTNACRVFGVHRSTYYAWKRQVDRHGLEMLRPRERRRSAMPNQTPRMVEERIVAGAVLWPADSGDKLPHRVVPYTPGTRRGRTESVGQVRPA